MMSLLSGNSGEDKLSTQAVQEANFNNKERGNANKLVQILYYIIIGSLGGGTSLGELNN